MLFMAIESFKDRKLIGQRFERHGRMLPEGVTYHASWVDSTRSRCFQIMEEPDVESLRGWVSRLDFEIVHVLPSRNFGARVNQDQNWPNLCRLIHRATHHLPSKSE